MSQDIFKTYPTLHVYYKTADGQSFFQESDARNHAKGLENKTIETVERPLEENVLTSVSPAKEYTVNAKDSIALIKEATSVDGLVNFADDERKSVKEAYDKKLAELNASNDEFIQGSDSENQNISDDETEN